MTVNRAVARLIKRDRIAIVEIDAPPVNALGHAVRASLVEMVGTSLSDQSIDAVVIACAGRTFFAGADISEFGKPFVSPDLNEVCAVIETASKPIVAAIHGTALGGGFELALACHYRIAVPSAKVGLPEVTLGLLPGAGGTQRLPRLAGVSAALDLIVTGKPISAGDAVKTGLVDKLAEEGSLQDAAVAYASQLVESRAPLRRVRDIATDISGDVAAGIFADYRQKNARLFRGFKAPENILRAIEAAVDLPFDQGLAREAELFAELMKSRESAAQRHLFFSERSAAKIPGVAGDIRPLPVESVAVIGGGTMGTGIAIAFLNADLPVTLIDLDPSALQRASAKIIDTIRTAAAKGRVTGDVADRRIELLTKAGNIAAVAHADLIVEAVFERLELKQAVFAQIDAVAKPGAIVASNTSFLDLDAIAAPTNRPENIVGLHFFAPANIMRLLEVVRGAATSDAVLVTAMALGRRLGKVAVMSRVCDGFIANRLMARRGAAAERIILEGPAPWAVDQAMTNFGFPMGVFAMLDLVGLDVIGWDRENSAGRTVQEILCESGRWGQKKDGGYYDYDKQRKATPSAVVEKIVRDFAEKHHIAKSTYSEPEIVEQLLFPVVNEGAKLLEEGIVVRASDIDVALVTGYGWPAYTGGPMFWGDSQGLQRIVEHLEARRDAGEDITVSPLLEQMAVDGARFIGP